MTVQTSVTKLIVHHSESPSKTTTFEDIRRWHVAEKKWKDIGYHVVIQHDGKVVRGRDEGTQGAHASAGGFNKNSLGLCLCGNFDNEHPTREQWLSLYSVLSEWCKKYSIKPGSNTIIGHRDAPGVTKTCPGVNVYQHLPLVRQYVQRLIAN